MRACRSRQWHVNVMMKRLAGRTRDLVDIEAIVGADRVALTAAVHAAVPDRVDTLERLFANVDRER